MNYELIYNTLMEKARTENKNLETDYELHHVLPACLCRTSLRYGTIQDYVWDVFADDPENIIKLTYKQHFLAHRLLAKLYKKMATAFFLMSNRCGGRIIEQNRKAWAKHQQDLFKEGEHNFSGLNSKRLSEGTHNFLKEGYSSAVQQKLVTEGKHHFQTKNGGSELARERNKEAIKRGTHISVNEDAKRRFAQTRKDRMEAGDWHTCGVKPWSNNITKEPSKVIYENADILFEYWSKNKKAGSRKLASYFSMKWSQTHENIIKMFRAGWQPLQDTYWLEFKHERLQS